MLTTDVQERCHATMPRTGGRSDLPSLAGQGWLACPQTQAVFRALADAGQPARAVGGTVRDALLGLPAAASAVDLATPAPPEAVIAACKIAGLATYPTGLAHGTVTIISGGISYEVTTLRRDVETFGRHATVAFTDDWVVDAARRDFTMNALYCDASGTVYDPVGGYEDLIAGRIRFIGDARARIREDYLRILRYFRFLARFGHHAPDADDLRACIAERQGLTGLSGERVRAELLKLLIAPHAAATVRIMGDCGLLGELLGIAPRPGIFEAIARQDSTSADEPDAILRLSALALAVIDDVTPLAQRLRLSNAERDALLVIDTTLLASFDNLDDAGARRSLYRLGPTVWRRRVSAARALASATHTAEAWSRFAILPDRAPAPRFPVSGADLINLGLSPGPDFGRLLGALEAWWIDQDFPGETAVRDRLAALLAASDDKR
jgi:poly(A) polymerase